MPRLAFACRLFGNLFRTFAVLCTPTPLRTRLRPHLIDRLPEAERPVGDGELRRHRQTAPLEIEEELLPRLRALADAVGKANEFLLTFGSGADDHQQHCASSSSRAWT